jgi:hypothetical protein
VKGSVVIGLWRAGVFMAAWDRKPLG